MQLAFLHDGVAVRRYKVADIAAKQVNPGFRLGRDHVDVELIRRRRQCGNIVRTLFALEVVESRVDGLGSREIKRRVFLRGIELFDCELLKSCALSGFVGDEKFVARVVKTAKRNFPSCV